jgi:hypothetical protein
MVEDRRQPNRIPGFRPDGFLPEGVWLASETETVFRFDASSPRRRRLALRVRRWIELVREVRGLRLLLDGSFVTAKQNADDVDAVVLLPPDFEEQIEQSLEPALELETMLLTRHPEELFAAEDDSDWVAWVEFFSRTREVDRRRTGLVKIQL